MPVSLKFNCPAKWSAMEDCGSSRFCQQCEKQVHNISSLSEKEAQDIISTPDTCVRFELNANGQILTRSGFSTALIFGSAIAMGCGEATTATSSTTTAGPELVELMGDPEETLPPPGKGSTESAEGNDETSTKASQEDCEESTSTEASAESDNSAAQSASTSESDKKLPRPAVMGKVHHNKPNRTETKTVSDRLKTKPKK